METKPKKNPFRRFWGWFKRHKAIRILTVSVLALAVVVGGVWYFLRGKLQGTGKTAAAAASFIRTATLQKGTLSDTVSATGTVESANVSSVTTTLNYAVKSVSVQVGDQVQAGDVICVLDTSSIEEQIEKKQTALEKTKETAQKAVTSAQETYDDALTASTSQETVLSNAQTALSAAQTALEKAKTYVAALQTAYDNALAASNAAGDAYATALNGCTATVHEPDCTCTFDANGVLTASDPNCQATTHDGHKGCTCWDEAAAYAAAQNTLRDAQQQLDTAKTACNYDALEKTYNDALNTKNQARSKLDELENTVEQAKDKLTEAKEQLTDASTSDDLEDLNDQLAECTLTAQSAGTVTALNATVGSITQGSLATIQDTDNLLVSFTVHDYDIDSVKLGQSVLITTDASDTQVSGVVSMISPTASTDGTFAVECTVDGGSNGLYIGMSASVEIVLSSVDDVYIVPYDAVGTDENGNSVIYKLVSGTGTDAVFEPVVVTTGAETDYYIEVSGDDLEEGMTIRASANAEEATTEVPEDAASSDSGSLFNFPGMGGGNNGGGDMPSGGGPSGGGDMPSGGGMPSGGNGGQGGAG